MSVQKPEPTQGMRHLALKVTKLEETVAFYTKLLGMHIEWQPDAENVYLTSGNDNLALHRAERPTDRSSSQALDHLGFILSSPEQVDVWYDYLKQHNVVILSEPKTHRDGARSFYCRDPDENVVQLIFHPPLAVANFV